MTYHLTRHPRGYVVIRQEFHEETDNERRQREERESRRRALNELGWGNPDEDNRRRR